jgi:hypothetical protein
MDNMFSRKTAALFLGLSIPSIDRYKRRGKLSYYKIGKRVLFSENNLTSFRDAHTIPAKSDGGKNDHNS